MRPYPTSLRQALRFGYTVVFAVGLILLGSASLKAQTIPSGYQDYHVTGNDSHIWQMFNLVAAGEGQPAFPGEAYSVVGVACSTENQVVYYDQWEDGLEADILAPVQSTTLVLGDGNPLNGDAHDFNAAVPAGADVLHKGTVLTFNSDKAPPQADVRRQWIPMPRLTTDIRFDGGDRILCSGGPLTVVHYQRPNTQLIAGSCETLSKQAVAGAYAYSVPVGTNTYTRYGGNGTAGSPFKYVYLDLVAFEDDTHVFIDNKGGGTASFTLMKGQHYGSHGWIGQTAAPAVAIREGTKVSTDKPITGLIFTGGSNQWQTRFFALLPDLLHGTDFVTTAPGNVTGGHPLNLYMYNPNPSAAITISYTDSAGTGTTSVPANSVRAYTELPGRGAGVPANSTVRLTSASIFWGISAYDYSQNITEWGHSWLATKFLSEVYSVSWSPGTQDPVGSYAARGTRGCDSVTPCDSLDRAPIWIAALQNNTRVQIDFNNDGVYDQIDTNSDDVPEAAPFPNNTYTVNAGQCLRVFDWTDYDNTGTQVIANKPVSVAYGQDGDQGQGSDPTLDLGNTVFPLIQKWLDPVLTLDLTGNTNRVPGATGGDVVFTLTVKSFGFGPLSPLDIYDLLPAGMTYVAGTTVITYPGGGSSTTDPGQVGNKLTWALSPDSLGANETLTIQFTGHLPAGASAIFRNEAHANAVLGTGSVFSPAATYDVVRTNITLAKTVDLPAANPGQNLTYTIVVTNTSATTDETGVVVADPLPANTTYVGPVTSSNPAFTGAFQSAQNAVVWTAATFARGTSATLTFVVQVNSTVVGGTVISNQAGFESAQTPLFRSLAAETTVTAPALAFSKSGPSQAFTGDRVTYDISATNTGNGTASNLLIVDPFPANATYAAGTMQYSLNGGAFAAITDSTVDGDPGYAYADRLEFHLTTLAAGSTVVFRFQTDVTGTYPGAINNQATVSCTGIAAKDTNLATVTIVSTDLSLSQKEVVDLNAGDVEAGDILEYTITLIESNGLVDASGVAVTDDIPAHVDTFTVVSYPGGATNSSTPAPSGVNGTGYLNITGITVPAGGSETIVFRVTVSAAASTGDLIANTAAVTNPRGSGATPSAPNLIVRQSQIPSSGTKPLYLRNATAPYTLTRAQPTNTANRLVTLDGNGGTPNRQWNLGAIYATPTGNLTVQGVIQVPIYLVYNQSASTIRVRLYYDSGAGNTLIGTDTFGPVTTGWHTFNLTAGGYSQAFPAGTTFMLEVAETGNRRTDVYYDMTTRNSRALLPCVNVIHVDSVAGYNAVYPGGSVPAFFDPGDTVYIRSVISDPFGSSDVTGATLTLVDPSGATALTAQAMAQVADSGTSTKTYEYAYTVTAGRPRGIWTATVTAIEGTETPSPATDIGVGTFTVRLHPPVVTGPIHAGASSISGTSDEPVGTTITVYKDGVSIGTTTVLAGGVWTLSGVSGLIGGEAITAKAGTGASQSAVSNTVIVTPAPPVVIGPIVAGQMSNNGTSNAPAGSAITVYNNGTVLGTATLQADGTWLLTGFVTPPVPGDVITATVTVNGQTSALSNEVTVQHPPPVVTGPINAGDTSISGTSTSPVGTTITVYKDGASIGTTTVQSGGAWTLTGVSGLIGGESITAKAGTGASQSAVSNTVVVTPAPPVVNSPIIAGATSVSGTSTAPTGSTITVYKDGASIGTTTVLAGGTWTLSGISPALVAGEVIKATVTAGGQTSGDSNLVTVTSAQEPPPVVNGPIYDDAATISGTSTSPVGTPITVYQNGVSIGMTTVLAGGVWTLSGVSGLVAGDAITAKAGAGPTLSAVSNTVIVQPLPPIVTTSILAGATSLLGSSVEPPGSTITVYVGGVLAGTTTVQADGSWTLAGVGPMADGQTVTATVTVNGVVSSVSNVGVVAGNISDVTPPPVITGPIPGLATSVPGTSVPGATVDVFADGVYLGTVVANGSGGWTLVGVPPLDPGTILSATATLAPWGTSTWSGPVVVGNILHMLRSDKMTVLTDNAVRVSCFDRPWAPVATSLDPLGAKHRALSNEGIAPQPGAPDTADGDKTYILDVQNGQYDPEAGVLADGGRPLIFYELFDNGAHTLFVTKEAGRIKFTW